MKSIRPASKEVAVRDYPEIALLLAQGRLMITSDSPSVDHPTVMIDCPSKAIHLRITSVDFELIRTVSTHFIPTLSPFLAEPYESILDRARSLILVSFGDRGAF